MMATKPINATALAKGEERYIFLWDDRHGSAAIQAAARWAANKRLSFTWYDAARVAQAIRQTNQRTIEELESRFDR
jgi:hypothetical protein